MENEGVQYRYFINTSKLFEMVSSSSKKEGKEREITTGYEGGEDGKLEPTSKVIREITSRGDTFIDNLKYDFVKTMVMVVVEAWDGENTDIDSIPGAALCLNTLIHDGIVVRAQVEANDEE